MSLFDRLSRALADSDHTTAHIRDERHLFGPAHVLTDAAVLIAVTDRADPGVILTQRPSTMRSHPGQVAFPGGKIDPDDASVEDAALREAEEELAIPRSQVKLIGTVDEYKSGSGFAITPVLGLIPPDIPLVPNPQEVESWFEVPLDYMLNADNHVRRTATWEGRERDYIEILWEGRRIWGVTAGIVTNLAARLQWPHD